MEEFKTVLEKEKATLETELETIAVFDQKTGDWIAKPAPVTGEADNNISADSAEDWNERRATVAQLETRLHNILIALNKFATHTFGTCEICNEEVGVDRLKANPAARTCTLHLERERELPL